jgi:hypothetical protein
MVSNTITDIVIPIICTLSGVFCGFLFRIIWERRINKAIKYDEIVLNNEINNLKEKLEIYWSIYFKLLICLSAKLQIKKIKESSSDLVNMIQMENDVIIKNLEDIVKGDRTNISNDDLPFIEKLKNAVSANLVGTKAPDVTVVFSDGVPTTEEIDVTFIKHKK